MLYSASQDQSLYFSLKIILVNRSHASAYLTWDDSSKAVFSIFPYRTIQVYNTSGVLLQEGPNSISFKDVCYHGNNFLPSVSSNLCSLDKINYSVS